MTNLNWIYKGSEWQSNKRLTNWGIFSPTLRSRTYKELKTENKTMATIREQAKDYISPTTKNISDLKEVSTEMDIKSKIVNEGTEDEFSYDYIIVDEIEYRVPKSVLKQLKVQLENKPECVKFRVSKSGEGLKTEYNVIMLD